MCFQTPLYREHWAVHGSIPVSGGCQEPSWPIPPHTHREVLSPTALLHCTRKFGDGIKARDPSADGSVCRGKVDSTGTLPPCPSQALCNLAVGKTGLTMLWFTLIALFRPSQRTDCWQGQPELSLQSHHPGLTHNAEDLHKPLTIPSAKLWGTAVPREPHTVSAMLPGCAAAVLLKGDNPVSPASAHFVEMFFQRGSQDPWSLTAFPAAWPPPPTPCPLRP